LGRVVDFLQPFHRLIGAAILVGWLCPRGLLAQDSLWQQVYTAVGTDVQALAINSDGAVFAGTGTSRSEVLRSDDDGRVWELKADFHANGVQDLTVAPDGVIYAGTFSEGFFRSSDGGATWNNIIADPLATSIAVDKDGVILAGAAFWVCRSEDQGDTCQDVLQSSGIEENWQLAFGPDNFAIAGNVGCMENLCGELYRSSDGGKTWVAIEDWGIAVYSVAVSDGGELFVGVDGTVVRSVDQGATWTWPLNFPDVHMGPVRSVVIDANGGLFAGAVRGVYRSVDNGETWQRYGLDDVETWALALDAEHHLYAGTSLGIHRSIEPTAVSVEENGSTTIPEQSILSRAYPNPFRGHTIITVSISRSSQVILKIYDLAGRAVATVFSGYLLEGTYKFRWLAEGLPSGVYLCFLETDTQALTRKVILLK